MLICGSGAETENSPAIHCRGRIEPPSYLLYKRGGDELVSCGTTITGEIGAGKRTPGFAGINRYI